MNSAVLLSIDVAQHKDVFIQLYVLRHIDIFFHIDLFLYWYEIWYNGNGGCYIFPFFYICV